MASVATLPRAPKKSGGALIQRIGRPLLVAYWLVCLAVIVAGAGWQVPELRHAVTEALYGPQLTRPFPNCAAAHAAGVYNIRSNSPGYVVWQDADNDGLACEPPPLHAKSKEAIVGELLEEGARPG
jgi:hypothetical protein